MRIALNKYLTINKDMIDAPDLTDRFDESDLITIGSRVYDGYSRDLMSRTPWAIRSAAAMDLAMQVSQDKNFPWPGCANVVFPLVTIAALQFSARSYPNLIRSNSVVKYRVINKDLGEVRERAKRIGRHMSWQVLEQDTAWEEQHDRLLINLAIVGTNFVKSYYNATLHYPVDELVMARDLVINYWAKSVESCPRKTHVIPLYANDIYERVEQEIFKDVRDESWFGLPPTAFSEQAKEDQRSGMVQPQPDETTPYRTLEQHVLMDLDNDGYSEPYIITVEEGSRQVLRIVARFDENQVDRTHSGRVRSIVPEEYFTKYSFIPSPDGGIYDLGFGTFLGPINEAVNTGINQLLDNGTMQNSLGGFLGRGAKIRGGVYTMAPWEWKRVDSTGDDLRKNLVPYPDRAPSEVMFKLIGLLIDYSNRIAGTTEAMVGENVGQNTPASTFQGMTEQGMQVYGAIFTRVWRSLKEEFKKRYQLNRKFLPLQKSFGQGDDFIRAEDYTGNPDQVAPVANPKSTSTTIRINQAMAMKQDSMTTPGYDGQEVTRRFLDALEIDSIEGVFPGVDKTGPLPNPKMEIEKGKLEVSKMKIQAQAEEWKNHLQEARRLNNAKIAQLEAAALKLTHDAGIDDAEVRIKAFDVAINALKEHNSMINERIQALMSGGGGEEGGEQDSNGGGVPGLGGPPGDPGASPDVSPVAGGSEGAVG